MHEYASAGTDAVAEPLFRTGGSALPVSSSRSAHIRLSLTCTYAISRCGATAPRTNKQADRCFSLCYALAAHLSRIESGLRERWSLRPRQARRDQLTLCVNLLLRPIRRRFRGRLRLALLRSCRGWRWLISGSRGRRGLRRISTGARRRARHDAGRDSAGESRCIFTSPRRLDLWERPLVGLLHATSILSGMMRT